MKYVQMHLYKLSSFVFVVITVLSSEIDRRTSKLLNIVFISNLSFIRIADFKKHAKYLRNAELEATIFMIYGNLIEEISFLLKFPINFEEGLRYILKFSEKFEEVIFSFEVRIEYDELRYID